MHGTGGGDRIVNWEAVFFDFDGVILDSMHIKTETFGHLFDSYGPDIARQVVDYHLANGGVSRFEKFKYIYKHFLKKPLPDNELEALGMRFSELALQRVLDADFIVGADRVIKALHQQQIPAFIVSGTPQEEIEFIIRKRELNRYFLEVHGSPRKKDQIVLAIQERHGYRLNNCIFLGDAMSDFTAAKETGTNFLGIVLSEHGNPFPEGTMISVDQVSLNSVN